MNTPAFVAESNKIEGITRLPFISEIEAHNTFLNLEEITIDSILDFVSVYEPTARLRNKVGMDYRIGSHIPPSGGWMLESMLKNLLLDLPMLTPYETHIRYEKLHPLTDCNGRSGRAIWAWMMLKHHRGYPKGFLHHFYYQSLDNAK